MIGDLTGLIITESDKSYGFVRKNENFILVIIQG